MAGIADDRNVVVRTAEGASFGGSQDDLFPNVDCDRFRCNCEIRNAPKFVNEWNIIGNIIAHVLCRAHSQESENSDEKEHQEESPGFTLLFRLPVGRDCTPNHLLGRFGRCRLCRGRCLLLFRSRGRSR